MLGEDGGDAPWMDGVVFSDSMEIIVKSILESTGPTDTAVVFDGGSPKARRKIEELFEAAEWTSTREVTIVFESARGSSSRAWKGARDNRGSADGSA